MKIGRKVDLILAGRRAAGEQHSQSTLLSNFILGCQDGLVNVLGIVLGVSAATSDTRIIYIAGLAALAAESISMGAVAYTSTLARRRHYMKEVGRERGEMRDVPKMEREEVRSIFRGWGYKGKRLEAVTDHITSNPKAWLAFMMAHELDLEPVRKSDALNSFWVVGLSTIFGSVIPLIPFIFAGGNIAAGAQASVAISGVALFLIGAYEAKITVGSLWRSGVQMAIIGLTSGLAGYLIGRLLGSAPI